jgi:hypothetical protein
MIESENMITGRQSPSAMNTIHQGTPPRSREVAQQVAGTLKGAEDVGRDHHTQPEPQVSTELTTSAKRFSFAGSAARLSLGRAKATSITAATWREVYRYNACHLLRVYPAAWKVDSR